MIKSEQIESNDQKYLQKDSSVYICCVFFVCIKCLYPSNGDGVTCVKVLKIALVSP